MSRPALIAAEPGSSEGLSPASAAVTTPAASPAEPSASPSTQLHPHPPHGLLPAVQSLLYIIIVALFIISFSVQPFRIPSASMEPALLIGDFILVDKELRTPRPSPLAPAALHRGDIVVFHFPVDPSLHLVKRIVALPGERVHLRGGRVYINDRPLNEPYAFYQPSAPDSFRDNFPYTRSTDPDVNAHWWMEMQHLLDHGDLRIPAGHYFVLGDNRNNSEDSRYWGLVPAGAIVGRPILVYLSLREPETSDDGMSPSEPRISKPSGSSPQVLLSHFARWGRTLHIVR